MSRAPARIGMAPPHPRAFIREEILDELGLTVSEAAKVLDVRRATLSDLINGNAALSAEMALRIEKACYRSRAISTASAAHAEIAPIAANQAAREFQVVARR